MTATLGCGEHRVMVALRGAAKPFAELDYSGLSYGRVLDDMSTASVTVDAAGDCCDVLGDLREWRHELWIYRNDEEVWRGPVTPQCSYSETQVVVPAKDHFAWFERRGTDDPPVNRRADPLSRFFVYRNVDLADVFVHVIERAHRRDPHPALTIELAPSGILTPEFHIDPFQRPRAADVMRSIAKMGVDFTLIGTRLLIGSPENVAPVLTYLTSDVVSGVSITPLPTASEVEVIGSNSGEAGVQLAGIYGYGGSTTDVFAAGALGIDPDIGLVIESANESDLNTQDAVSRAARTRYEFYQGNPVNASMTLDAQAPVDLSQLIPGARVRLDVDSTCRVLSDTYRLQRVNVNVAISDGEASEAVSIEVAPLGSVT